VAEPRLAVNGQVLTGESGRPVPGTVVTLYVRRAGEIDSAMTTTDDQGLFRAAIPFRTEVTDSVSLRISPPGDPGYVIRRMDCRSWSIRGDACVLPPIIAQPKFALMRFLYRNQLDRPAANVRVSFRRTGGTPLYGPSATEELSGVTDAGGYVQLFTPGIFAAGLDPVVGQLTVDLPAPNGPTVRDGFPITPLYEFAARPVEPHLTGPTLNYLMVFYDSASRKRLAGVRMQYVRTAGIPTHADSVAFTSGVEGLTFFTMIPRAKGTVMGDLTVEPAGRSRTVFPDFSLDTFDADSSIVVRRFRVGVAGGLQVLAPDDSL
jgi:hypothetical protein